MSFMILPGIAGNTAGLPRVLDYPTVAGFPADGLSDLLLFSDGSGASAANAVEGRTAGVIEFINAGNNAYAWLGGGGIQLDGTQIVSLPALPALGEWSLVSMGAIVGSVGGTASERICGIVGFREFTGSQRGAGLYVRGANDWNNGTNTPYYQYRGYKRGALGTAESLTPGTGLGVIGSRRLHVLSHDGAGTITATVYSPAGVVIAQDVLSTQGGDEIFMNSSGVSLPTLTPCIGLSSSTYSGGRQHVEAFARYEKVLSQLDVVRIGAAASMLGQKRGRYW